MVDYVMHVVDLQTWNEKHLDYEIETSLDGKSTRYKGELLEMKSISITRLKLEKGEVIRDVYVHSWNEKHLDYEIETRTCTF